MYNGNDISLKIPEEVVVVRLKDETDVAPITPNITIEINRIGINIRFVVVRPLTPQMIIRKIKISER